MGKKELKNIPLFPTDQDVDQIESGSSLINGVINRAGSITGRPGLKEFVNLGGNPIDELFYWKTKKLLFGFSNGNIYKINENREITDITGDKLEGGLRPNITSNRDYFFAANGGRVIYSKGDANTAFHPDSDAPTKVSQLAYYYNYLLMNNLDIENRVHFSEVSAPLSINPVDRVTSPINDNLKAIKLVGDDLLYQGENISERWQAATDYTGVKTFEKLRGIIIKRGGTSAPNSFVEADTYYWLNQNREIVALIEGQVKIVSIPINSILKTFPKVDDTFAIHMPLENRFMTIFGFPSAGRVFCDEYMTKTWSEWTWWNLTRVRNERWLGNCGVFIPEWNKYFVGSRRNGKIYEMSFDYNDDDGDAIRTEIVTPFIDHGFSGLMQDEKIILKFKRGFNVSPKAKLMFQFRNSGKSGWSNERTYSFGEIGQTEYSIVITSTGEHRGRQYKFSWTGAVGTIFVGAQALVNFKGF